MGEGLVRIAKLLPKFFFKSPAQGVSLKFLSTPLDSVWIGSFATNLLPNFRRCPG